MKYRSQLLWIFTVIFTLSIAVYQRMTGPTYPVRGTTLIDGSHVEFKLLRSHGGPGDAIIKIEVPDKSITGKMKWKRYKSHDEWSETPLIRVGEKLSAGIPHQPPAGKVEYAILLQKEAGQLQSITDDIIIIRFKGAVPGYILFPHIFFMFFAMMYSSRAGLAGLFGEDKALKIAIYTVIFLFIGGIILGPIVQKFAFGAYWTGWPRGHDMTDNKTALAFIMWLVAIWRIRKNPRQKWWVILASLVLLAVYLVPHSVLGSEIDYTQVPE